MLSHINLQKHTSILACILILSLLELSCKDLIKPKQLCTSPPATEIREALPSPSQNLVTDIYFDSTVSMQGFISDGNDSYYQQTIAALERPIISSGGQVNFFDFGTSKTKSKTNKNISENTIRELSGRSYREANTKDFYSDPTKDTLIQNALNKADNSHLTIVITDLFQDQTDIDLLSRQIREKFIKENLSVGVFAIKSQFQGKIYDVGRNNYSFDYVNQESIDTYRPFYILAFGKHSDIANYFKELANTEISSNQEKHIIIFSRYLTSKLPSISEVETLDIRGLNEVNSVLVADSGNNSNYKEFNIIKGSDSSFYKTTVPFNSLPDTMQYGQIKPLINSCQCQNNQTQSDQSPAQSPNNNSDANSNGGNTDKKPSSNSAALEIDAQFNDGNNSKNKENLSPEGNVGNNISKTADTINAEQTSPSGNLNKPANGKSIDLNVKVLPEKLESNTIHCFRVSLNAEKYSLPNWVFQWNLTDQEIETWHKNQSPNLGKTYNLVPFLQTILNSTVEEHKPKVADFYFYIQN